MMTISDSVAEKIINDNQLSLKAAIIAGVSQSAIIQRAQRRASSLITFPLVELYKKEGFTEDEIFTKAPPKPKRVRKFNPERKVFNFKPKQ